MSLIAIHPERVADAPGELRWVMPAGTLCCSGPVTSAPAAFGALMASGAIAAVFVEDFAVRIALGPGLSWRADGAAIRSALHEALAQPDGWRASPAGQPSPDERLAEVAEEVLAGRVGDFIRSHGGRPSVSSAKDGVVAIRLRGACDGCPAAGFTLRARLEGAIRERFPELRGITAE
jgi:Fe-S cluster biogenesis protein NfuA